MPTNLEIWQAANVLVQKHAELAAQEAEKHLAGVVARGGCRRRSDVAASYGGYPAAIGDKAGWRGVLPAHVQSAVLYLLLPHLMESSVAEMRSSSLFAGHVRFGSKPARQKQTFAVTKANFAMRLRPDNYSIIPLRWVRAGR